jgi:hypothetical protein
MRIVRLERACRRAPGGGVKDNGLETMARGKCGASHGFRQDMRLQAVHGTFA